MIRELDCNDLNLLELVGYKYLITEDYNSLEEFMVILITPFHEYQSGLKYLRGNSKAKSVLNIKYFNEVELVDNYFIRVFIDFPESICVGQKI